VFSAFLFIQFGIFILTLSARPYGPALPHGTRIRPPLEGPECFDAGQTGISFA